MTDEMTDENPQQASEDVRQAASDTVQQGVDVRDRVRDITLMALRRHRLDHHGVRDVARAVTEGMAAGAEKTTADMRYALSEAFRGLDDAMQKSAVAGREALQQLATAGKDFSESEFKHGLESIKKLEDEFLAAAHKAADMANDKVRPELRQLLEGARRGGTETGRQVAATMGEFAQRFSTASMNAAITGLEAAGEIGTRFSQIASGVLNGIAEALAESRKDRKST